MLRRRVDRSSTSARGRVLAPRITRSYVGSMDARRLSVTDRLIGMVDQALHTIYGPVRPPLRPSPAAGMAESGASAGERDLAGRLMRINHSGEVCAQALYQGQALTARGPEVGKALRQAALEENDHLAWCAQRIGELGSHTSYLNPLWYAGSLAIGSMAGLAGDKWSLGFLAETERQVVAHLEKHLARMPANDHKSRAIVEQMRAEERQHATVALESGGARLSEPVRRLMRVASSIMTGTAHWI